jgi:hypothetical protein
MLILSSPLGLEFGKYFLTKSDDQTHLIGAAV